jgi:serine protease AprX
MIVIIFSLTLQGAGELAANLTQSTNSSTIREDVIEQNEFVMTPGFVFPNNLADVSGLSLDGNRNGIEDFIEANKQMYLGSEFINTVTTLTQPAGDWLIDELEKIGCKVNHIFTIIDAVGLSIPIDRLHLVGQLPTVQMIQSVHTVQEQLSSAVPLTRASQDILRSNGYSDMTGEGVTVAIIDSGIDVDHSTFGSNRIIAFKDFWYGQDDLDPTDGMDAKEHGYHGTMVASCAVGSGSYKGVAIKSNIISVSVYNTFDMIQGIEWCVNNKNQDFNKDGTPDGPDVITMSMGTPQLDYLDNTAGSAMDNGVVFTTSAGNEGPGASTVTSPATSAKVIAVGATSKYNKQIATFSSRGPGPGGIIKPDIVAPGDNIIVAYPGNTWTAGSGTSFSGPIIAGIAALILQYDPSLDPYEVKDIMLSSAQDMGDTGPDNTYGHGFVDTIAALDRVLKIKSISASPSSTSSKVWEDTEVSFSITTTGANINKYEWDFDSDGEYEASTTSPSAKNIFTDEGIYDVNVRITNQRGKTAESSYQIEITNRKPIADLEIDDEQMVIYEDDFVIFNARAGIPLQTMIYWNSVGVLMED